MRSPPASPDALAGWAAEQGVSNLLTLPASAVVSHLPATLEPIVRLYGAALTVGDLAVGDRFTRSALGGRLDGAQHAALSSSVRGWLALEADALASALDAERRLLAAAPPTDPALAELHGRLLSLRAALRAGGATPRAEARLALPRLHLDEGAPALVYGEGFGDGAAQVQVELASWDVEALAASCSRCEGACDHALTAIDRMLALCTGPAPGALIGILETPSWDRLLRALDGGEAQGPPEPLTWSLRRRGQRLELAPSLDPDRFEAGARPADRRAAELLVPGENGRLDRGRVLRALLHLCGHPRVHLEGVGPVVLREGRIELVAVARPGGAFALAPALDDQVLELDAFFGRFEAEAAGGLLAQIDEKAKAITLFDLRPEARRVLLLLQRHGALFPSESHEALLARVPALQTALPVRLPLELKGEEMRADPTPVLRLDPGDDGLSLELLVRPVPGGPSFPPGHGTGEVAGFVGPRRVWAPRDLQEERLRARKVLAALAIPDDAEEGPFRYRLAGEGALDLVHRLGAVGEAARVEWPSGVHPWRIQTPQAAALHLGIRGFRDWFGLSGGVDVEGEQVQLALLLEAVRSGRRYVPVSGGLWMAIADDLREHLAALADHLDAREGVGLAAAPALVELLEGLTDVSASETWSALAGRVRQSRRLELAVPEGLEATLRPYQLEGLQWMARLAAWGAGAVLADDMGLGKTVQTIGLLLHRAPEGPALVVAPTSVLSNWQRELARFAPSLRAQIYGAAADREALVASLGEGDVLLVSYGLLARDGERLSSRTWGTLVLDEAQAVKNPSASRSRAVRAVEAGFRLALTGTPVENHLGELWSLFAAILPGLLGSYRQFRERFAAPIEQGSWARREALSRLLRPFILRRTKRDVLPELPPRVDVDVSVALSPGERRLYEEARLAAVARVLGGVPGRTLTDEQRRFEILSAITRLRLLACHPRLHDEHSQLPSSKLGRLLELVDELGAAGHRALVFSQFTRHLALVREALDARGVSYLYLDGGTPQAKRGQLVDAFQRGRGALFLVSLKAGGTGLNLTAADHVIHLDPWWNPALEDQATDRAHRMGQKRSVTVLRLVSRGTIEEAILDLHQHKRGLLGGILEGAGEAARISDADLQALLAEGQETFAGIEDDEAEDGAEKRAPAAAAREVREEPKGRVPKAPVAAVREVHEEPKARVPVRSPEAVGVEVPAGPRAIPPCLGGTPQGLDALLARFERALLAEGASGARTYPRALRRFGDFVKGAPGLDGALDLPGVTRLYLDALGTGRVAAPPDEPVVARSALSRLAKFVAG